MTRRSSTIATLGASKKARTQKADTRALERVVKFIGRSRNVETLSESDVQRFILARRQRDGSLPRVQPGKGVRDGAIEADLVVLLTALNWATKEALAAAQRAQGAIGNTPVFPAPKDLTRPCSRHLFDTWLRKAYEITELPRERWMM